MTIQDIAHLTIAQYRADAEFQIVLVAMFGLLVAFWLLDAIERARRSRLQAEIAELKDMLAEHEGCDGGQWAREMAGDLSGQLWHVHDLMKRGFAKDARHELERAIEDVEEAKGEAA